MMEIKTPVSQTEVAKRLNGYNGDYLADVFRAWDCDSQCWVGAYPIVFRFENCDVLLSNTAGTIAASTGAIDVSSRIDLSAICLSEKSLTVECICWRRDASWSDSIGIACSGSELARRLLEL